MKVKSLKVLTYVYASQTRVRELLVWITNQYWPGDKLTLCEHDDDIDDDGNVENVF